MQELIPAIWDDLDYAEGRKSAADRSVTLSLNGLRVELDLTWKHNTELEEFLEPYLTAGRKVAGSHSKAPTPGGDLREKRRYNKGMKEFADARGLEYTVGPAKGPHKAGKIYWPKKTRDAYAAHLRSLGQ